MNVNKETKIFERCSHPDCECPLQDIITNVHCEKFHNMTKKEMVKKYGEIQEVKIKVTKGGGVYEW